MKTEPVRPAPCESALSGYEALLFFPDAERVYLKLGLAPLTPKLQAVTKEKLGCDLPLEVVSDGRYAKKKKGPKEILFGREFDRPGIPAFDPHKSFYGITEDGTVYFRSPCIPLYATLWKRLLSEFGPDWKNAGPCYREVPPFSYEELERAGYSLVFEDTFDGEKLNMDVWESRHLGPRRCGYQGASQARLENGNLVLTGSYEPNGEYGEGWYGLIVQLQKKYCRGYFEATIKCCENLGRAAGDIWSAFWIQGDSPYRGEDSQGGIGPGGAEIDVMENFGPDYTTSCIWVTGVEGVDGLCGELFQVQDLGNDFTGSYHTYGCLWDEDAYRIYVDGMLIAETDHACGTSRFPEKVLLSIELPEELKIDRSLRREMFVDTLRIWQKS